MVIIRRCAGFFLSFLFFLSFGDYKKGGDSFAGEKKIVNRGILLFFLFFGTP